MTVSAGFLDDRPDGEDMLERLRTVIRAEGAASPSAQTLFHQFYCDWYETVDRWAAAKVPWVCLDEVVQETFWRTWQWVRGPSPLPAPPALLRHCLQWAVPDVLRTWFGRPPAGQPAAEAWPAPPERPATAQDHAEIEVCLARLADTTDVEDTVLQREVHGALRAALAHLPPPDRACVTCRYLQSLSVRETAARLGLTVDQVKKHTARGIGGLATMFLGRSFPG